MEDRQPRRSSADCGPGIRELAGRGWQHHRIKLGGETISSQLATGPQTLVYVWAGSLGNRQIKVGKEKELAIEFQNDVGRSTTGYIVRVQMAEGCVLEYQGARSGIAYCDADRKLTQLSVSYIW